MTRSTIFGYATLAICVCSVGCAAPRMTFEASSDQPTPTVGLHFERPPETESNPQPTVETAETTPSQSVNATATANTPEPFGQHKRVPLRRTDQTEEPEQKSLSTTTQSASRGAETAPFSF
ncbi:hypothetical protein [Thalassoroseus pseudoceratinae]|uniref:hypothetical protein n=1 Tax=Thalassoroseus pseudoceratinae TaxID=2713176 RepID=UPI0014232549|nr:hypothetical protein [Thalassoroseus pseudoceratinae]